MTSVKATAARREPVVPAAAVLQVENPDPGRWELLRALGALALLRGDERRPVEEALELGAVAEEDHTEVFVLECPPHASLHLGAAGQLGGEAADRVAGFSRALGLVPPPSADHLAHLLDLYATLGERSEKVAALSERAALMRAREALLFEHLWSWLPGYLAAVAELGCPSLGSWARLLDLALSHEVDHAASPARLPLALRVAPPVAELGASRRALLEAVTVPLLSGMVLTRSRIRSGAAALGAGMRVGERRYALGALIDQEPEATLGWLALEARRWSGLHGGRELGHGDADASRWWRRRAASCGSALVKLGKASTPLFEEPILCP